MDLHQDTVLAFAASLICLLLIGASLHSKIALSKRRCQICLVTAAALALFTFFSFGSLRHYERSGFINYHEHFHYYLGAKYFSELGYDGLYAASLAAQRENRPAAALPKIFRDLRTNEVVPRRSQATFVRQVKDRFTPQRWEEFRRDHSLIMRAVKPELRGLLRLDHGYNPPPSYTAIAQLPVELVDPSPLGLRMLSFIDILLVSTMFGDAPFYSRQCSISGRISDPISDLDSGEGATGLAIRKQAAHPVNVTAVQQKLLGVLAGYFIGFFTPEVTTHTLAAHKFSRSGDVDASLGAFVGLKFWHQLNLRLSVPPVGRSSRYDPRAER